MAALGMTGTWPGGEETYFQDQEGSKRKLEPVNEPAERYENSNWRNAGFERDKEQVYVR